MLIGFITDWNFCLIFIFKTRGKIISIIALLAGSNESSYSYDSVIIQVSAFSVQWSSSSHYTHQQNESFFKVFTRILNKSVENMQNSNVVDKSFLTAVWLILLSGIFYFDNYIFLHSENKHMTFPMHSVFISNKLNLSVEIKYCVWTLYERSIK